MRCKFSFKDIILHKDILRTVLQKKMREKKEYDVNGGWDCVWNNVMKHNVRHKFWGNRTVKFQHPISITFPPPSAELRRVTRKRHPPIRYLVGKRSLRMIVSSCLGRVHTRPSNRMRSERRAQRTAWARVFSYLMITRRFQGQEHTARKR